jgi:CO/xanthine dehydrogenase Mo-binding subunit/CO/xanthine dehydrogenase FAD-binding subunit
MYRKKGDFEMPEEFSVMGKGVPRADAIEKVKGEAIFASDRQEPRMLHAKFLRSPYPHAKITDIDTAHAEALPGVKVVLTFKNVPKIHAYSAVVPSREKFEYLLDETVHYAGEEIAAVAATTKETAEEALGLISVEYKTLPAVFDKEEAISPEAPLVHPELGSNLYQGPRSVKGVLSVEYGDVDKGFLESDEIIEGTYESPFQHNVSPEPRSILCQWVGKELNCWVSTQIPQAVRSELAEGLSIPLSRVRVISTYTIGGYGGKQPGKIVVLTAILARKTGRPVKAVFSREEDTIATHHRMDAKIYGRLGMKKDGRITTLQTKMISNYGRDSVFGYNILANSAATTCSMLYRYENTHFEGSQAITNIEEHGAMNGFGDPEAGFCIERLTDEAAERIGMDPVEFRLKNCARYGDKAIDMRRVGYGPITWDIVGPDIDGFQECINRVAEKSSWREKWKGWKTPVKVKGPKKRGIGMAIGMHHCLARTPDYATVKMNQDGTADVLSSDPEVGQGLRSAMGQVVAEVLGLQSGDVNVLLSDTSVTPYGHGIFGSRGTIAATGSAYRAALDVKRQLVELASKRLDVAPGDIEMVDGQFVVKDQPEKRISMAAACRLGNQVTGEAVAPYPWIDERTGKKISPVSVAATIAEVEVDTETGELNVLRLTSAHDCGKAINPNIVENQIDMSLTLANGWVRSEEVIIDRSTGVMINPSLIDYKIMSILDMPKTGDQQEILVEIPNAWGPFGAKGMSETATTTGAPAIANAVYNAIGVRIRGDHLTPERILEALGEGRRAGKRTAYKPLEIKKTDDGTKYKPLKTGHVNAKTLDHALSLLTEYNGAAKIIAGGTDLIRLMKNRVVNPGVLVNIKTVSDLNHISEDREGLKIGPLTTIHDVEMSDLIRKKYPMLGEAAYSVASPHIRNMGTVMGNLCQDTQCWYYRRSPSTGKTFFCRRKGGKLCFAHKGENAHHVIIGGDKCFAPCPSDMATALCAMGASLKITGSEGERTMRLENLYTSLGNTLQPNEIMTEIQVPAVRPETRQSYLKFAARKTIDFANSSVAVTMTMEGDRIKDSRIFFGGIAPVPYRAIEVEEILKGETLTEKLAGFAAESALKGATPLSKNAYKLPISRALLKRAILEGIG